MSGSVSYGHTEYEFEEPITLQQVLTKIKQPITKDIFLFQRKIIADELKGIEYGKKLWEKFYQILLNNPNIHANNVPSWITLQTLNDYQSKRYQESNMILADENNVIDTTFWKGKTLSPLKGKQNYKKIQFKNVKARWESWNILSSKYATAADILILDFLCYILDKHFFRQETFEEKKYARYDVSTSLSEKLYFIALYEKQFPKTIKEEIFNFAKQYVLTMTYNPIKDYGPVVALYLWENISISAYKNFIKTITYEDIQSILDKIHSWK